MAPGAPELKRIEATIHFQQELDEKMRQQFPLIRGGRADAAELLMRFDPNRTPVDRPNSLTFVSFQPKKLTADIVTQNVLAIALQRAADPNDKLTFCHHAAEHVVFEEAVAALIQANNQGALGYEWVPQFIKGPTGKPQYNAQRLKLTTPPFVRDSFRPQPYVEAKEKLVGKPPQTVAKGLRRIARESGVGRALLLAGYAALEAPPIMAALDEEHLKNDLRQKGQFYLTRNRPGDWPFLMEFLEQITIVVGDRRFPRRSPEAYRAALLLLQNRGLIPDKAVEQEGFRFVQMPDEVTAVALLLGMSEIAQREANPEYLDPARINYIDRTYGPLATTIMATAYILED